MLGGIVFLFLIIAVLAISIICTEHFDKRESMHYQRLLDDSVRCTGFVNKIERKGILDSSGPFLWRVKVEFEYEGMKYSITHHCRSKPWCAVGDKATVLVDIFDPDLSIAIIK